MSVDILVHLHMFTYTAHATPLIGLQWPKQNSSEISKEFSASVHPWDSRDLTNHLNVNEILFLFWSCYLFKCTVICSDAPALKLFQDTFPVLNFSAGYLQQEKLVQMQDPNGHHLWLHQS